MSTENYSSACLSDRDLLHVGGLYEKGDNKSHPDPDEMHRDLAHIQVEGIKKQNSGFGTTVPHSTARNGKTGIKRPYRAEDFHVTGSAQNNHQLLSPSISGPQMQRWHAEAVSAQPWNHLRNDTAAANDGHGKN